VVLRVVGELDGITDGGIDLGGREGEARGTDLDLVVCRGDGGDDGGEGNGSEMETHFDCSFSGFRLEDPKGVDDNLVGLCENLLG
jgi:hypothetical protein